MSSQIQWVQKVGLFDIVYFWTSLDPSQKPDKNVHPEIQTHAHTRFTAEVTEMLIEICLEKRYYYSRLFLTKSAH